METTIPLNSSCTSLLAPLASSVEFFRVAPPKVEVSRMEAAKHSAMQFYGLYLLIKGYLLLNCRLLEPQGNPKRAQHRISRG